MLDIQYTGVKLHLAGVEFFYDARLKTYETRVDGLHVSLLATRRAFRAGFVTTVYAVSLGGGEAWMTEKELAELLG